MEEQNGRGSDAALAKTPVAAALKAAAPNKMTNRSARANVAGALTRTRGVDVVIVVAMVMFPSPS